MLSLKIHTIFCNKLFCTADNFVFAILLPHILTHLIKLNASQYLYTRCVFFNQSGNVDLSCLRLQHLFEYLIRVSRRDHNTKKGQSQFSFLTDKNCNGSTRCGAASGYAWLCSLSISSLGLASHLVYSQHLVRPELKQVHGSKTSGTIFHFHSQKKRILNKSERKKNFLQTVDLISC